MKRGLSISIGFALLILLVGFLWWQRAEINSKRSQPPYYRSDQRYVVRAVDIWAAKGSESPAGAMENRYPVTVHLKNVVCVELRLNVGSVGGNPAYCFKRQTAELVYKFDDVE